MSLFASTTGDGSREFCFVHGFTQTGKSWVAAAQAMGDSTNTFVDAPDHGESQGISLSLQETGDELADIAFGKVLIGYSMGARMALHAAIQHPYAMTGLVLVSGTPGIEDDSERAARVQADEVLASRIESIGTPEFIQEWIRHPLFAKSKFSNEEIQDRSRNTPASLATSLRKCGTGQQEPLWVHLQEINIPVLLICGARDEKFTEIAKRMNQLMPHSTLRILDKAGHNAHLDQPEAFAQAVNWWLQS
jgi:2-succinyl-6-hydroxy-2,4-cyclohexadiene-1-carboxylate synthase